MRKYTPPNSDDPDRSLKQENAPQLGGVLSGVFGFLAAFCSVTCGFIGWVVPISSLRGLAASGTSCTVDMQRAVVEFGSGDLHVIGEAEAPLERAGRCRGASNPCRSSFLFLLRLARHQEGVLLNR